jgi:hypothetical protein
MGWTIHILRDGMVHNGRYHILFGLKNRMGWDEMCLAIIVN